MIKIRRRRSKKENNGTKTTMHDEKRKLAVLLPAILVAFACHYLQRRLPSPLQHYFSRTESSPVLVYDNVLSPSTCKLLHQEAIYVNEKCQDVMVVAFHWPLEDDDEPTNGVEAAINSILNKMYSPTSHKFVVEYWTSQVWRQVNAHPDIDGALLFQDGIMENPIKGHVLYLQKGRQVNGPTVAFSNVTTGGDWYTQMNKETTNTSSKNEVSSNQQEVLIVPFVEGRLLQFQGNVLHAVPRPVDAWFHPNGKVDKEDEHDPFDEYGRSVILFNLWNKVPTDAEFSEDIFYDEQEEEEKDYSSFLSNPKSVWKSAPLTNDWKQGLWEYVSDKRRAFTVPLMGAAPWRGTKDYTVKMRATNHVERALASDNVDPKRVYIEVPPTKEE